MSARLTAFPQRRPLTALALIWQHECRLLTRAQALNCFYDVPVYRLPEGEYYRQRQAHADKVIDPSLRSNIDFQAHVNDAYGGIWRFNEVIGYIRLHFLGSQVRGEYFAIPRKRYVRSRNNRQFEYQTHKLAPEINIEQPPTESSILAAVRQYLEDCKTELPGRHIELEGFEIFARHIRWMDLWRNTLT
jgi:hypothetical protein